MSLNINKDEMDQSWIDRKRSDKFYNFLYSIAKHQVSRKGINFKERDDYIQFALYKCFMHQDSYTTTKGRAYSFFWKQISLAIAYKLRKIRRRQNKATTIFVEQEKILDWAENIQLKREGTPLNEIVEPEELSLLKKAYDDYNASHRRKKLKPNKKNTVRVLKWVLRKSPNFLNNFTTLKMILKNWLKTAKAST